MPTHPALSFNAHVQGVLPASGSIGDSAVHPNHHVRTSGRLAHQSTGVVARRLARFPEVVATLKENKNKNMCIFKISRNNQTKLLFISLQLYR